MWNSSRRIALLSTGLVVCAAGLFGAAWLAHWLPIEIGSANTGDIATQETLAELDSLDWSAFSQKTEIIDGEDERDSHFVHSNSQSEPAFTADSDDPAAAGSSGFVDRNRWLDDKSDGLSRFVNSPKAREIERNLGVSDSLPNRFPESQPPARPAIEIARSNANGPIQTLAIPDGDSAHRNDIRQTAGLVERAIGQSQHYDRNRPSAAINEAPPGLFQAEEPPSFREARGFPTEVAYAETRPTSTAGSSNDTSTSEPVFEAGNSSQSDTSNSAPVRTADRTPPTLATNASAEPSVPSLEQTLTEIDQQLDSGQFVAAHRELSKLYWNQPELKSALMERLEKNARTIYFSPQPHFLEPYEIQSGDFLQRIAPKYKVTWQYLASLNRVEPNRIRAGQKLKVIKGPFSAFVDLSDFELTVHCHGFFVKRYQVGTGRNGSTPIGKFAVLERIPTPQYTDPDGRVIQGGDPANPLGTHWIDLGDSYGIHGTIEPKSIGKAESRGCIRMRNDDVAEVYNFLVKGSEVVIRP